jgi:hypothetical protein
MSAEPLRFEGKTSEDKRAKKMANILSLALHH